MSLRKIHGDQEGFGYSEYRPDLPPNPRGTISVKQLRTNLSRLSSKMKIDRIALWIALVDLSIYFFVLDSGLYLRLRFYDAHQIAIAIVIVTNLLGSVYNLVCVGVNILQIRKNTRRIEEMKGRLFYGRKN